MPLIIEIWDAKQRKWVEMGQVMPGDPPGSISNNTVIGVRELFMFSCSTDGAHSTVSKVSHSFDIDLTSAIRISALDEDKLQIVAELRDGDSREFTVITDRGSAPKRIRLRHVVIDFGTRHCYLCGADIPAQRLGMHLIKDHEVEEFDRWPGGMPGVLTDLKRSLTESIKRAKGFPRVQDQLKATRNVFNDIEKRLKANWN